MSTTQIFVETVVVGVVTAIIGFVCSTALMYVFVKQFSIKKYHFWWQVLLSYFLTGCLIHIIFQITGINKWYCEHGAAAQPTDN